jgi:hypothetical protein
MKKDEDGIALDILFDHWYKIRCLNCSCMPYSSNSNTIEAAIHFWNTRRILASVDDGKFLIRNAIDALCKVLES